MYNRIYKILKDSSFYRKHRSFLKKSMRKLETFSLKASLREHKLDKMFKVLEDIVPDMSDQRSGYVCDEFLQFKHRCWQAFQVQLSLMAFQELRNKIMKGNHQLNDAITIVDIGDSSGAHLMYLKKLLATESWLNGVKIETLSINVDPHAVNRIKAKGMNAVVCKAEDFNKLGIHPEIILSFQTVEHLQDPIAFLNSLSLSIHCQYFVVTVPYVMTSQVGLNYIRSKNFKPTPENTHIYELSPTDWRFLALHSGWSPVLEKSFLQYPKYNILTFSRFYWKIMRHIGCYGFIFERERKFANQYFTDQ